MVRQASWAGAELIVAPETAIGEVGELKEKAREAQRKLAKHRIQTLLLMQVRDQLVAYKNYAQAKTTPDKKEMLLAKYNKLIGLISGILADKKLSKTDEQLNERIKASLL